MGRVVGFVFFVALVVAGLTSSFSLLEVGTASFIDEFNRSRKTAAIIAGGGASIAGLFPALCQETLGVLDKVVGELLVVGGVLGMALFVGWRMNNPESELLDGTSPLFRRLVPFAVFLLRYVIPPFIAVILWFSFKDALALVFI